MALLSPATAGLLDRTLAASDAAGKARDLFASDVAVGVVFDLRLLRGIPLSLAPFAAFAKSADGSATLVGFYWSDSAASAALAGPFTAPHDPAGLFIPGDRLYRTDADGNRIFDSADPAATSDAYWTDYRNGGND